MSKTPLELITAALDRLDTAELSALRVQIDQRLRLSFKPGDLVRFDSDKAGETVTIRVDRVNHKSLSGVQQGGARHGLKWRVAPQLCRLVGADKPAASAGTRPAGLPDLRYAAIGPAASLPAALRPDFGAF